MSSIQYENWLNIIFKDKCDIFIKAMYSKNSLSRNENNEHIQSNSETMQWNKLNHIEIENVIKYVNFLKTCESDEIN
jgi:hypothetical protein